MNTFKEQTVTRRSIYGRLFGFLGSVKFAVPLLMVIAAASIGGSLVPQGRNVQLASDAPQWVIWLNTYLQLNDIFHSWWYNLLLELLGLCLFTIALKRFPTAYKQRGRGAGLGVLLAHLGILIILVGMVYSGLMGFRFYTRLVEGEVTVLPTLPFVIKLNSFRLKYYPQETFQHWGPDARFPEQQDSAITLFHHGNPFLEATIAPGRPVVIRGVTLLPSDKDIGWSFNIVLTDPNGREKVVPVWPWAPAMISMYGGKQRYVAHRLTYDWPGKQREGETTPQRATEVFWLKTDGPAQSMGFASEKEPLKIGAFTFSIDSIRPYTGLHIYRRPEKPFFIAGFITLLAGLAMAFSRRRPKG